MADAFADAGYTTGRIGSADLPRGQLSGFDFAELGDVDTDLLARLVELAGRVDDRPLFLWLHLSAAHYPWPIAPAFNRFDAEYRGKYRAGLTREEFRAEQDAGVSLLDRRHFTALYDGAILQMDTQLRDAFAKLDATGFFADAIVAVTADHGAHFGEHGVWFMHSTPWRASLGVPLVIVAPSRVPADVVVPREAGRALLVDLRPTLLELAGLPEGDGLDGVSLRPAWSGGRLPMRTTVTHFQPASYAVVENYRYALFYNPKGEPLTWPGELHVSVPLPRIALYDRRTDPEEARDLADTEPLIVGALRAEAEAHAGAAAQKLSTEARQLLMQAGYANDTD
jgi:arylsulfatase A-like enzyme